MKINFKNGLMGLAIASSLSASIIAVEKQEHKSQPTSKETSITAEGKWAAGLSIYGAYASDSSASAAGTVMGGFAALAAVIPGGQFAAGYYGL